ncbi:NADP-dependent phosphogluconate dehydrogenase [Aliiroseovarius sp. PTFE2010]|uniref:NADP-dependent phosphogluconate dehydrogenase n=1 Tax=Aliiroseovarius sp. PTFE2010 TaxID=3417190 RepID=UPI003CE755CE
MARIGLYGLGVMGANLALNIADSGFDVAVSNRSQDAIDRFADMAAAQGLAGRVVAQPDLAALVGALDQPRSVIVMVAASAVDAVIADLAPLLSQGDTIIDAGNANFHDTRRREGAMRERGLHFIGMGVSGGEEGARHGPSIMVGGAKASYAPIRDIIEAISAKYQGQPCAAHLGPDGAGHFVKTVHNGIEYADMQIIAEVYGLLRDGAGWPPARIGQLFERWNKGPLQSYLIEITGKVLQATDPATGGPVVDVIVDAAGQKGTGRWTVIEALSLGQSASSIEAAVAARSWSALRRARAHGQELFGAIEPGDIPGEEALEQALLAAKVIAYSQGFSLLQAASDEYGWSLDLARCAEIWRAGCIIRSALLDDMANAVRDGLPEGQLIFAPSFGDAMQTGARALRSVVSGAALKGLPVPAFSGALAFFDTMRQARGSANLIQAQRDFFGAHGFVRLDDARRDQHGPWGQG